MYFHGGQTSADTARWYLRGDGVTMAQTSVNPAAANHATPKYSLHQQISGRVGFSR
jgi:hypothetical protein